jgi:hypothetical protein
MVCYFLVVTDDELVMHFSLPLSKGMNGWE